MKGLGVSVGWRELNELLEEKIPWYSELLEYSMVDSMVFRIVGVFHGRFHGIQNILCKHVKARAVCWWVPFLFTQKGIQHDMHLGFVCSQITIID